MSGSAAGSAAKNTAGSAAGIDAISIAEPKKSDYPFLEKILQETWRFGGFCGEKTAKNLSKVYLADSLLSGTFAAAATVNGKAVGIVVCRAAGRKAGGAKYRLADVLARVRLSARAEGRIAAKFFADMDETDARLLAENKREYGGELLLFAVDAAYRGRGIGKALFSAAEDYFARERIREYYVCTDTDCDYAFYEKHGFVRRGEISRVFQLEKLTYPMTFFLYDSIPAQKAHEEEVLPK